MLALFCLTHILSLYVLEVVQDIVQAIPRVLTGFIPRTILELYH